MPPKQQQQQTIADHLQQPQPQPEQQQQRGHPEKQQGEQQGQQQPQQSRLSQVLLHRGDLLVALLLVCAAGPFVYAVVSAALWPGLVYCPRYLQQQPPSCPSASSRLPPSGIDDLASIVVVLVLNTLCAIAFAVVLASPGASMRHARRNKLLVLLGVVAVLCSTVLILVPPLYRPRRVLPLRSLAAAADYSVSLAPVSPTSATVTVADLRYASGSSSRSNNNNSGQLPVVTIDGDHLDEVAQRRLLLEIREASGDEQGPEDVDPLSAIVFTDHGTSYADNAAVQGSNLTRSVDGLVDGRWYSLLVAPALEALNGAGYAAHPLVPVQLEQQPQEQEADYLDLRGFALCRWTGLSGCQQQESNSN